MTESLALMVIPQPEKTPIQKAIEARPNFSYENVGRPSVVTDLVIQKLEEAFAIGCSDGEACLYANISKGTLYNYQKENKEFLLRKEALKEKPILKARQTVINNLHQPDVAFKFLERKRADEFGPRLDFRDNTKDEEADDAINKLNKLLQYARESRNEITTDDTTDDTSS